MTGTVLRQLDDHAVLSESHGEYWVIRALRIEPRLYSAVKVTEQHAQRLMETQKEKPA